MSDLYLIPVDKILAVMPDVQPMLQPAIDLSDGRWDLWSVIGGLLSGQMQLWVSLNDGKPEAAMVTRVVDYPKLRVLSLPFLGGSGMRNWLKFEPQIMAFAKAHGCKEMEGYARLGFKRVLKGWIFSWSFMRRPLAGHS